MSNLSYVVAIQARLKSTRLPFKTLLPVPLFLTKDFFSSDVSCLSLLEYLFYSHSSKYPVKILVPYSDLPLFSSTLSLPPDVYFPGDEVNVLHRYVLFARNTSARYIVRLCSDSPSLTPTNAQDYISYVLSKQNISSHFITTRITAQNPWKGFNIDIFDVNFLMSLGDSYIQSMSSLSDQFMFKLMEDFDYQMVSWSDVYSSNPSLLENLLSNSITIDTTEDYLSFLSFNYDS